jgi:RimJ/RimL family protein N-acetyltransferase
VEFGISIGDKSNRNKGHSTEALHLLLRHAFNTLSLNPNYLRVNTSNPRARCSYEKAGLILEEILRQALFRRGGHVNPCHEHVML